MLKLKGILWLVGRASDEGGAARDYCNLAISSTVQTAARRVGCGMRGVKILRMVGGKRREGLTGGGV